MEETPRRAMQDCAQRRSVVNRPQFGSAPKAGRGIGIDVRARGSLTCEAFLAGELDSLRRYARLLTGDRDTAHDVVADALIKAHVRWAKIGRMEFPAAYVRSMVTNGY